MHYSFSRSIRIKNYSASRFASVHDQRTLKTKSAFWCFFYVATISQYINYCTYKWINLYFVLYHDIVRFEFAFIVILSSKNIGIVIKRIAK